MTKQVIPEAAVKAGWLASLRNDLSSSDITRILEAAAPHMLAPVLSLAADWEAQGERDIALSKTIEDEHISMELLTEGAAMVENARHIRNAIGGVQ